MFLEILLEIAVADVTAKEVYLTPEVWGALIGLIIPPIIAFLKTPITSRLVTTILVGLLSFVGGVAGVLIGGQIDLAGEWDVGRALAAGAVAFTSATVFYNTWFRDISLNAKLEAMGFENPPPGDRPTDDMA